ncbi:MAG: glutathione S-transferase, partial [Candidatus Poriferisodalaceae bacterium]
MTEPDLTLIGAFGSPYSIKMRAVLRYRHIPFRWIARGSAQDVDIPEVPVAIIPVIAFHDGDGYSGAMVDSSPQIAKLESTHHGRSVVP